MQAINFLYPEKSEIKYHIDTFPDSQKHLILDSELNRRKSLICYTRLACLDDIWILLQLNDICKRQGIIFHHLCISYLFAARTDRLFSFNEAIDLDIILNLLKGINVHNGISIFEPHSVIKLRTPYSIMYPTYFHEIYHPIIDHTTKIIFPDEGAQNRYGAYYSNAVFCKKTRNAGKVSIVVPDVSELYKNYYVIDDLCDGGGTFFKLYEEQKDYIKERIHLIVAHAIQKQALIDLSKLYKTITITNSFKAWENEDLPENIKIIKLYE